MKTNTMRKMLITSAVIFFVLSFFSTNAFPWRSATHVYIDDHIGKDQGWKNRNEIYGGMA